LGHSPLRELVAELRAKDNEEELLAWLRSRELGSEREAARKLVEAVVAPGLRAWSDSSLREWRKTAATHWIVPVWYLLFIEQCDPEDIPDRLQSDAHENPRIGELVRKMLAACETQLARTPLMREKR
jgi:hypothetical protein